MFSGRTLGDWLKSYQKQSRTSHPSESAGIEGIRGNNPPEASNLTVPGLDRAGTELTSVQQEVLPSHYFVFKQNFLAERYGVQAIPTGRDEAVYEVRDMGSHLSLDKSNTDDTILKKIAQEADAVSTRSSAAETIRGVRQRIRSDLSQRSGRSSPSVHFRLSDNTTRSIPADPVSRVPAGIRPEPEKLLNFRDLRNKLTPNKTCNTTFFHSCSDSFIYDTEVWDCLTEPQVLSVLKECKIGQSKTERETIARDICGTPRTTADIDFKSYRKVFAILILLGKHDRIVDFVKQQIHDSILPLLYKGTPQEPTAICHGGDGCHPCFEDWAVIEWKNFLQYQNQFCAPYFKQAEISERCYHYKFPKGIALPFLDIPEETQKAGGSAVVKKVILPEEHGDLQSYNTGEHRVFAVKRLHSPNRKEFEDEAYVLARLNKIAKESKPNHLTVLSATFEVGTHDAPTFYFVFPCADGNLKEFWRKSTDVPDRLTKFSKWMVRQLHGLSQALHMLHNFKLYKRASDMDSRNKGIHGDIKPENVLLFGNWNGCQEEFGMLQLADFGLTRYHHTHTVNQAKPLVGLHPYCPPESELQWNTGQSLDVWSLGCLFLEFSVWLVFGFDGLRDFQEARESIGIEHERIKKSMFYDIHRTSRLLLDTGLKIKINSGVLTWIGKIHNDDRTTKFLHDFVDFILLEMLALATDDTEPELRSDLIQRFHDGKMYAELSRRKRKRIKIANLVPELEKFLAREDNYFHTPCKYGKKEPIKPAPIRTSMTASQVRKRAKDNALQAQMMAKEAQLAQRPNARVSTDIRAEDDSILFPQDAIAQDNPAVKKFRQDTRRQLADSRRASRRQTCVSEYIGSR